MTRFLLRGGCVLTLGARTPNYPQADILIDGNRIAEIGTGLRARDAELIDATDTIVMPGFVDCHRHMWKSLFRNLGNAPSGAEQLEGDEVYAATLVGLLGAAEAGITTAVDWLDAPADVRQDEAALQAHADSGLRTVLAVAERVAFEELASRDGTGRTTVARGINDLRAGGEWSRARELGRRIHAHAGTEPEDAGTIAHLSDLLGRDVSLIHCTHLDHRDLDAIAATGTNVILTPTSEMTGGVGLPPIQKVVDRKLRPGLGVDDETLGPGDMFAQMRATISLQHATYFDLKLAGKAGLPNLLTTREVIRFATIDGATSIGLGAITGSLEPGKQADLVVLRADRPNIAPVNDPIGAVVWGMDTSNIDWVFAAGQALMRQGVLTADLGRARELAIRAQRRVSEDAGALTSAGFGDNP